MSNDFEITNRAIEFKLNKLVSSDLLRGVTSGSKKIRDCVYSKESMNMRIIDDVIRIEGREWIELQSWASRIENLVQKYDPTSFYEASYKIPYENDVFTFLNRLVKPAFEDKIELYATMKYEVAIAYKNNPYFLEIQPAENSIEININSPIESVSIVENNNIDEKFKNLMVNCLFSH
jgi:hypothetical protein